MSSSVSFSAEDMLQAAGDYMRDNRINAQLFAACERDAVTIGVGLYCPLGYMASIYVPEHGRQPDLSATEVATCLRWRGSMLNRVVTPLRMALRILRDDGASLLVDPRLDVIPGIAQP